MIKHFRVNVQIRNISYSQGTIPLLHGILLIVYIQISNVDELAVLLDISGF